MPLGSLFGGGSAAKAQPLSNSDTGPKEKPSKKEGSEKDARGTVLKLQNHTVVIDRKLAEGGFAIVYLVTDKQNRHYALKRQFINDDLKQVEACKRECQIISSLRGHKNIVHYNDHFLQKTKSGVYDYMLLTAYYKTSVLGLMNDRLSAGKGLTGNEVMNIFCDMCEAVSRLHHSHTPVIHRDLKVENILVDDRNRASPPIYVLCDFGSATTKVLSTETHSLAYVQEEIERYTTLSYRSPEMVDLYSGKQIGTKADIWAMGVMLYKLCYFSLPFGDSAMAIQNGAFTFPPQPAYPIQIKTIIKVLLESDIGRRPNIFQAAALAFDASGRVNPVQNVYKVSVPSLNALMSSNPEGRIPTMENKEINSTQDVRPSPAVAQLCSTMESSVLSSVPQTTSVNPRLRPKPTNSITLVPVPPSPRVIPKNLGHGGSVSEPDLPQPSSFHSPSSTDPPPQMETGPLSCPLTQPNDLGFTDLEDQLNMRQAIEQEGTVIMKNEENVPQHSSIPPSTSQTFQHTHRRNVSDCSTVTKSAFKPYSSQTTAAPVSVLGSVSVVDVTTTDGSAKSANPSSLSSGWNPFTCAPYGDPSTTSSSVHHGMDDDRFGQCFDELPRNKPEGSSNTLLVCTDDIDSISIDSRDPFGAAPFEAPTAAERRRFREERERDDSVGSAGDILKGVGQEDSSDVDEVRVASRRRFSYEHIDGVGDDASSDSRARTEEDDSNTDDQKLDDEDDDASHSQTTEGGGESDEEGGSRPLLDDDELEHDYEDHDALWVEVNARKCTNPFLCPTPIGYGEKTPQPTFNTSDPDYEVIDMDMDRRDTVVFQKAPLPIVAPLDIFQAPATLPRQVTPLFAVSRQPPKPTVFSGAPDTVVTTQPAKMRSMPATVTSCAPPVPQSAPVVSQCPPSSISSRVPSGGSVSHRGDYRTVDATVPTTIHREQTDFVDLSRSSHPPAPPPPSTTVSFSPPPPSLPPHQSLHSSPPDVSFLPPHLSSDTVIHRPSDSDGFAAVHAIASSSVVTSVPKGFGFNSPKVKKDKKKVVALRKNWSSSDDSPETDDSGAEMFGSQLSKSDKDKKKKGRSSTFSVRSSHPSIAPTDLKLTPQAVQKNQQKRASSSKRGSAGAVNASFVNSSFQAEDIDSPPSLRNPVLQNS